MKLSMSGQATGHMWIGLNPHGKWSLDTRQPSDIIRAVLNVTGVTYTDFVSHRRWHKVYEARQLAYWFMRHYTSMSLPQIGRCVGKRDHSTVHHGIDQVQTRQGFFKTRINAIAKALAIEEVTNGHAREAPLRLYFASSRGIQPRRNDEEARNAGAAAEL